MACTVHELEYVYGKSLCVCACVCVRVCVLVMVLEVRNIKKGPQAYLAT